MITHYDLFAGIGGFSLALDEVFNDTDIRHIFCEWERFPTAVLKRHWPDGEFWGDIAELVAHTNSQRVGDGSGEVQETHGEVPEWNDNAKSSTTDRSIVADTKSRHESQPLTKRDRSRQPETQTGDGSSFTIVTGGFPCQPFSHAGRRKGTADDRYQWPNMFAVIRNVKPEWVIAENVRGLVTWNDGLVLETVCADLESEGYEVQPFIIPAVAVNAPHRRDRVWIIASRNSVNGRPQASDKGKAGKESGNGISQKTDWVFKVDDYDWNRPWQEVAFATCDDSVDDGLREWLVRLPDGTTITRAKHRKEALKAYGNGIVP